MRSSFYRDGVMQQKYSIECNAISVKFSQSTLYVELEWLHKSIGWRCCPERWVKVSILCEDSATVHRYTSLTQVRCRLGAWVKQKLIFSQNKLEKRETVVFLSQKFELPTHKERWCGEQCKTYHHKKLLTLLYINSCCQAESYS